MSRSSPPLPLSLALSVGTLPVLAALRLANELQQWIAACNQTSTSVWQGDRFPPLNEPPSSVNQEETNEEQSL
jgi:hypothetical protein